LTLIQSTATLTKILDKQTNRSRSYLDIDVIDELYDVEPVVGQVHFDRSGFGSWNRRRPAAADFGHFR